MLFLFQRLKMALITTRFSLKEKKNTFPTLFTNSESNDNCFCPYVEDPASLVPTSLSSQMHCLQIIIPETVLTWFFWIIAIGPMSNPSLGTFQCSYSCHGH